MSVDVSFIIGVIIVFTTQFMVSVKHKPKQGLIGSIVEVIIWTACLCSTEFLNYNPFENSAPFHIFVAPVIIQGIILIIFCFFIYYRIRKADKQDDN